MMYASKVKTRKEHESATPGASDSCGSSSESVGHECRRTGIFANCSRTKYQLRRSSSVGDCVRIDCGRCDRRPISRQESTFQSHLGHQCRCSPENPGGSSDCQRPGSSLEIASPGPR